MPKYLVVTRSFYDVERTAQELGEKVQEAQQKIAKGEERFSIQDLTVDEISVFPGEGGVE